ncbi:MAG: ABC transporter permease, partial [Phormidesmis sp.]
MAPETRRSFLGGLFGSSRPLTISVMLMYIGIAITLVFALAALFAPLMQSWGWIQDPTAGLTNLIHEPPSAAHWFGTSRQGYDIFARTLYGARAAWQVVLLATAMSVVVGVPLGMFSGSRG